MAGLARASAALTACALLSAIFARGNAQVTCSSSSLTCDGTIGNPPTARDCCLGTGMSYDAGSGCLICAVVGYTNDPESLQIDEGSDRTLTVAFLKPPFGAFGRQIFAPFLINNAQNTADVRVGGSPTPTGRLIFPFILRQGFTIRGEADQIGQEGVESFQIPLMITEQQTSGVTVFAASPAVVEITDRTVVRVELTEADYQKREGTDANILDARISYSRALANPVRITFTPVTYDQFLNDLGMILPDNFPSRDREAGVADFDGSTITVELPAGGTSGGQVDLEIPFVDDLINEPQETFVGFIEIENAEDTSTIAIGRRATQLIINDNDNIAIGYSQPSYTFNEDSGQVSVTLQKDNNGLSEVENLVVTAVLGVGGTATENQDFTFSRQDVTFQPSDQTKTITFNILNDEMAGEGVESFILSVERDSSLRLLDPQFPITEVFIEDDDVEVGFEQTVFTVPEDVGSVELCAVVTNPPDGTPFSTPFTLITATQELTAEADSDYTTVNRALPEFSNDDRRHCFFVTILPDVRLEDTEQLLVVLSRQAGGSGVRVQPEIATINIVDDDRVTIGLTETEYSVMEGDGLVSICAEKKDGTIERDTVVTLTSSDLTAEQPEDYSSISVELTFTEGNTEPVCTAVIIREDDVFEDDERFRVSLTTTEPSIVTLDPEVGEVVIGNDDAVLIGFEETLYEVSEGEPTVEVCAVIITGTLGTEVTVDLQTSDGTALQPSDYATLQSVLTFSPSTSRQCRDISISDDGFYELDETFLGRLSSSRNGVLIQPDLRDTTIQINDDDSLRIGFQQTDITAMEGNDARLCVAILDGQIGRNVPISFRTQPGTATDGRDYTGDNRQLTFGVGNTDAQCVDVPILEDNEVEPGANEMFTAILEGNLPRLTVQPDLATVSIQDIDVVEALIGFTESSYTVLEGQGVSIGGQRGLNMIVRVLRGEIPPGSPVDVTFSTGDLTAIAGSDYSGRQNVPLRFTSTNTEQMVFIPIIDDADIEDVERFMGRLSINSALFPSVTLNPQTANVDIISDDVVIGFVNTDFSVSEAAGAVSFDLRVLEGMIAPELGDVIVTLSTIERTAEDLQDYIGISGQSATFNAGNTQVTAGVAILNDDDIESVERFLASLTVDSDQFPGVRLDPSQATIDIFDDDVVIGFDQTELTVDEDAGTVELFVRVLEGSIPAGETRTVTVSTSDRTADSNDYERVFSEALTFSSTSLQDSVTIRITDDTTVEGLESFVATLEVNNALNPGVILNPDEAEISIRDNDVVIGFVDAITTVSEGDDEVVLLVAVQDGSVPAGETYIVTLTTMDGTADDGQDYERTTQTLTFTSTTRPIRVNIPIVDNNIVEPTERFSATLTVDGSRFPGVTFDRDSAEVEILDDDVVIGFDRTDYTVNEGMSVTLVARVFEGTITQPVVVSLSTADGTATTRENDYNRVDRQPLTFRPGNDEVSVTVRTNSDNLVELREQFFGRLSVNSNEFPGVTLDPDEATIDIIDNTRVRIVLENNEYTVGEEERRVEVCARVEPRGALQRPVVATLSTRDDSAEAGDDYSRLNEVELNFNVGDDRVCRTINIVDDNVAEPEEERFTVTLDSNDPDVDTGPPDQADVIIIDDDEVQIGFEEIMYAVNERDRQVVVGVVLDGDISEDVRVRLDTTDGTATSTSPVDYTSITRTLTFRPNGPKRQTVIIQITNDDIDENLENFFANLELVPTDLDVNLSPEQTEIEIIDNDEVRIGLDRTAYTVDEDRNTVEVCARIIDGSLERSVEVDLFTSDMTAESRGADRDYDSISTTLTFDGSTSRQCVDVRINDDNDLEEDETFQVSLTTDDAEVDLRPDNGDVLIVDDDDVSIGFERPMYTAGEDDGSVEVCAVITDGGSRIPVVVTVNSQDGTATSRAPIDYSAVRNRDLTFAPGSREECFSVTITSDNVDEDDEDFTLVLTTDDDNVIPNPDTTTVEIEDVDDVTIGFERTIISVGENDGTVEVCALIIGNIELERSIQVDLSTQPDTAEARLDYSSLRTTLRLDENSQQRMCRDISINTDNILEGDESFTVTLDMPSDGVILQPDQGTIVIQDGTDVMFGFERPMYPVMEGDEVEVCVVLQSPASLGKTVTLQVTSEDISAEAPADYTAVDMELIFQPGSPSECLRVTTASDSAIEQEEEQLRLRLYTDEDRVTFNPETTLINIIDDGVVIIGFENETYSVDEVAGEIEVCARIFNGELERDVIVVLATQPRSADGGGVDYDSITENLVFNAGTTRECRRIPITDDPVDEDDEIFIVTLTTQDEDAALAPDETEVTIIDNDNVTIGFERTVTSVGENDGTVEVCAIIRNGGMLERDVRVVLSTQPDTATANADYIPVTETLVFDGSSTRQCEAVPIRPDDDLEDDESFTVTLTTTDDGVDLEPDVGTIIIMDESEVMIGFENTEFTVPEGNANVEVCATVMQGRIMKDVEVTFFSGSPGTAELGVDYGSGEQVLPFSATVSRACVNVIIRDDDIVENSETFTVRIDTSEPRVTLRPDEGVVTIIDDDDVTPEFEEPDYSVPEDEGPVEVCVRVPAGQLEKEVVISLLASGGTATGGVDYSPETFEVTFTSGSTRVCTEIGITDDDEPESPDETFVVTIPPGPGVTPGPDNPDTTVTIIDNDVVLGFEETEYIVDENGTVIVNVVVLEGEISGIVRVRVTTRDGSATTPEDYGSPSDSILTFSPGTTSVPVSISIDDDDIDEVLENFFASLTLISSEEDNVLLEPNEAEISIVDDDGVRIGFEESVYSVDEDAGIVTVNVRVLDGQLSSEVEVQLNTQEGTATSSAPSDYGAVVDEVLVFGPLVTAVPVTIDIVDDNFVESVESFFASLTLITSGADVDLVPVRTEIRITDTNVITPKFEQPDYSVPEDEGPVEVCVVVEEGDELERDAVVVIQTEDNTATAGQDYSASTFELTFIPGTTRLCREIPIVNDTVDEPPETFTVSIPPSPGVDPGPPTTVTIVDDDEVTIGFEEMVYLVLETAGRVVVPVVLLDGELSSDVTVRITTEDGTATGSDDYGAVDQILTFGPGRSNRVDVPITIISDALNEMTLENFFANLELITPGADVNLIPDRTEIRIRDIGGPEVVIGLENPEYSVDEGDGPVQVCARIFSGSLGRDVNVVFSTQPGTANANDDYTSQTATFTFSGTQTRNCQDIPINPDDTVEDDETFSVTLTTTDTTIILSPDNGVVTIGDDDDITPEFEEPDYSVPEDEGPVEVCVRVPAGQLEKEVVISLLASGGTATGGVDYSPETFEVTFTSGSTRVCTEIGITDDDEPESPDETFVVTIPPGPGVTPGPDNPDTTVTIIDDDVVLGFEETEYIVDENSGTVTVNVVVLEGEISGTVRVRVTTSDGSATSTPPEDYRRPSDSILTFSPGTTSVPVSIPIVDDDIDEELENFFASLTLISSEEDSIQIRPDGAEIFITDNDDVTPEFEEPDYSVPEDEGPVEVCVRVPAGQLEREVVISLLASGVTATGGVDYSPETFEVTFTSGSTRVCTEIGITDDDEPESPDETFVVTIPPSPGVTPGPDNPDTTVTIIDNDVVIGFEKTMYTVEEDGQVSVDVSVLEGSLSGEVLVRIMTRDGSATAPDDYDTVNRVLTFSPSTTRVSVPISIVEDNIDETLENFFASLTLISSDGGSVQLRPDRAVVIIRSVGAVTIGFDESVYSVDEDASQVVVDVVVLDGELTSNVEVELNTQGGSATRFGPSDYTAVSNRILTFGPDTTHIPVSIDIINDDVVESVENFFATLMLRTTEANVLLSPDRTEIRIVDDDEPTPEFEQPDYSIPENRGPVEVCIRLPAGQLERNAVVSFVTSDGTAVGGEDYTTQSIEVTFTPSSLRMCRVVPIIDDSIFETDEYFTVSIPNVPGNPTTRVTIVDDDELCRELSNPAFGMVVVSGRGPGDTASYTCDSGFILIGSPTLICMDNDEPDWSPEEPFCQPMCEGLSNPGFGTVTVLGQSVGDTATYECRTGFDLVGPPTRTCTLISPDSADWSGEAPICRPTCEGLNNPGFGTVTVLGQSVGDTATYECRTGFDLVGPPTRTCTLISSGSADWSGEAPICRPTCEGLNNPGFGTVTVLGQSVGDTATYECRTGFDLVGPPTRTCTLISPDSADWSGEAPICRPTCEGLNNPGFGTVTVLGQSVGDTATYECRTGFDLVGPPTRTCTLISPDSADWSGEAPICRPTCEGLNNPGFGTVTVLGQSVGDTATYECRTGFDLVGPPTRTCTLISPDSADWSGEAPICRPTCEGLNNPGFGTVTVLGQSVGDTATYECRTGFDLVGPPTRTCTLISSGSADWSGEAPICRPTCEGLNNPGFGTVTVLGQSVGDTATYECRTGFDLVGPPTRTCTLISPDSADWSGEAPICRPTCEGLNNPGFGTVTVLGQSVGDTATYECRTGFDLVGPPTRTCTLISPDSADWSGEAPICRPTCEGLNNPGFGTVTVLGQSVGDTATYECRTGFDLVGPPTRTCTLISPGSADWSGEAPICERVTVRFLRPSYTFTESGVVGTVEVVKSGVASADFSVRVSGGPSTQPNIERSAADIDEVITFMAGPDAPNTISVTFDLTDDDVALEEVERYFASLTLVDSASGVLIVQPEMTQINVLDDDVVTVMFGQPEASFNESEGMYSMCIVKDRVTARRVSVTILDTSGTAIRNTDYRPVPQRIISIEPTDDRTCFQGIIIDDVIGLEDVESFTLSIELPAQDGVELGLDISTINIIDDDVVITDLTTSTVRVFEGRRQAVICAKKDIETARPVEVVITTSPGLAQDIVDYLGGAFEVTLGTEREAENCLTIIIVRDIIFEDIEDFNVDLSVTGDETNVVVGPDDTGTVLIDDVGNLGVNDTLVGDPLLTVPLPTQSLESVNGVDESSLCYEIHGRPDAWFNMVSDGCVSVNAHYTRLNEYLNIVDKIAIRAVNRARVCVNMLIELQGCVVSVDGVALAVKEGYRRDGIFIRPYENRVRISVPNCNDTSTLVMWTICQTNRLADPYDMTRMFTAQMIKFVIARGFNLGASAHGIIGQFWNIPIDIALFMGTAADADAGQRYIIQVSHPSSTLRVFTGLLFPVTWEQQMSYCLYAGNRQGGTIQEVEDPNDSVIEGIYTDYIMNDEFTTDFKFSHFDESICS